MLARHGFHATVFIATGVTGGRRSFPGTSASRRCSDGTTCVGLDREGTLRFEAHTVSHPNLLSVDDATAAAEIGESRGELERRLGRAVSAFAYPAGLFGERERRLVAAAGYSAAVSCEPGVNTPGADRFTLRRRQIDCARHAARLPGEGRRRARHAAAAAARLPPAALRDGGARDGSSRA